MISVSEAYKELMQSNIRPKCEPVIKLTGLDENGESFEVVWEAKNITSLSYKRGTDPLGRELPFMTLEWEEVYDGLYDEENMPYKYNNLTAYSKVELSFAQNLSFFNTWKTIKNGIGTWKDVLLALKSWKNVRNLNVAETIKLPNLFLTSTPKVENNRIKWEARDLLYFMNGNIQKIFNVGNSFINGKTPIKHLLVEARASMLLQPYLFEAINTSLRELDEISNYFPDLTQNIICDGQINSLLMNYISLSNGWMDFGNNGQITFEHGSIFDIINQEITSNIMYEHPTITKGKNISQYTFKQRVIKENSNGAYEKTPIPYYTINGIKNEIQVYRVDFDNYGVSYQNGAEIPCELNFTITTNSSNVTVNPLSVTDNTYTITTGLNGEAFSEENALNMDSDKGAGPLARLVFLKKFLSKDLDDVDIKMLPNIAIEPCDVVTVETNFFENGESGLERVVKKGYIKSVEIKYNGAIEQTLKVGEKYDF